jgi:hypothetical protein
MGKTTYIEKLLSLKNYFTYKMLHLKLFLALDGN